MDTVPPFEKKIVPKYSQPVPLLMVHKDCTATECSKMDISRKDKEDQEMSLTVIESEPKSIKVPRQAVLKALREAPVLLIREDGLIMFIPYETVARIYLAWQLG